MTVQDYAHMTGAEFRAVCRANEFTGPTAGTARGFAQANLVVLPEAYADDFARFCELNPKPCPVLEITAPGEVEPVESAPGADLRTDLPRYRVLRHGETVGRPTSITEHWRDDLVSFLIGCSFTFEAALLREGLPVRHIESGPPNMKPATAGITQSCNVPMYRTNIACNPSGPFRGPLVVSMRPMTPVQAKHATEITKPFEKAHGAPVQIGDPAKIGIQDLARPHYGDAVTIRADEIPVFWACGVTPMEAIARAKPSLAFTHDPGHMFMTDLVEGVE